MSLTHNQLHMQTVKHLSDVVVEKRYVEDLPANVVYTAGCNADQPQKIYRFSAVCIPECESRKIFATSLFAH